MVLFFSNHCSLNRILDKCLSSHLQLLNHQSVLDLIFSPSSLVWLWFKRQVSKDKKCFSPISLFLLFKLSWIWGQEERWKRKKHIFLFSWAYYWNCCVSLLLWLILTGHLYPLCDRFQLLGLWGSLGFLEEPLIDTLNMVCPFVFCCWGYFNQQNSHLPGASARWLIPSCSPDIWPMGKSCIIAIACSPKPLFYTSHQLLFPCLYCCRKIKKTTS